MKSTFQLEKLVAKLESINHIFREDENQLSYDSMKSDAEALINEMIELILEDAELENDTSEENE